MRKPFLLFILATIISLLGCARGQAVATTRPVQQQTTTPQILPVPSLQIAPTDDLSLPAILAATETQTPTLIAPTIDPTYFNFPTNTPTPTIDPSLILLRIVSPGPMSKVVSPIEFIVHIAPDYTGFTQIELIGEDGVRLYSNSFKTYSNIGYFTRVDEKIQYEINGAAEMARLQISTVDKNGRVQAFNSVRLLLQAVGGNEFSPPLAIQDRTLLRHPSRNDQVSGGDLPVTGEFLPANNQPIVLELLDEDGNVLGSRLLQLGPADGKYQQFSTSIPYTVNKLLPVQLVIRQSDDRIDGLSYLYSLPLIIGP